MEAENNNSMEQTAPKKRILVQDIVDLMYKGYTRTPKNPGYNAKIGSIQEEYELSDTDIIMMFKDPRLTRIRTRQMQEVSFMLVDSFEEEAPTYIPNEEELNSVNN